MIGKALEALLASTDYVARFFSEYPEGDAEPLKGARVALLPLAGLEWRASGSAQSPDQEHPLDDEPARDRIDHHPE